jgi:hypothetical protein
VDGVEVGVVGASVPKVSFTLLLFSSGIFYF